VSVTFSRVSNGADGILLLWGATATIGGVTIGTNPGFGVGLADGSSADIAGGAVASYGAGVYVAFGSDLFIDVTTVTANSSAGFAVADVSAH